MPNRKRIKKAAQVLYYGLALLFLFFFLVLFMQRKFSAAWIELILLLLLFFGFGWLMVDFAMNSKFKYNMVRFSDYSSEREYPLFKQNSPWLLEKAKPIQIPSKDGLILHGQIIEHENSHLWVIACHGYGNKARDAMCNYARGFYDEGCNILLPLARGHHKDSGKFITMGWKEKEDLLLWAQKIVELDAQAQIYLFGLSMGAATVMMASSLDFNGRVIGIIEDCGYSCLYDQYKMQLKAIFGLPAWPLLSVCSFVSRLRCGISFKQVDAKKQLAKTNLPMLFIHGKKDGFVPFEMLDENVQACSSTIKETLIMPEARHGESIYINTRLYWQTISKFMLRCK
jgi:fermentation-respiration switch protein FrsA (DUF1100 family)